MGSFLEIRDGLNRRVAAQQLSLWRGDFLYQYNTFSSQRKKWRRRHGRERREQPGKKAAHVASPDPQRLDSTSPSPAHPLPRANKERGAFRARLLASAAATFTRGRFGYVPRQTRPNRPNPNQAPEFFCYFFSSWNHTPGSHTARVPFALTRLNMTSTHTIYLAAKPRYRLQLSPLKYHL